MAASFQSVKEHDRLLPVAHHQNIRGATDRFGIIVVGGVKQDIRPLEAVVHNFAAYLLPLRNSLSRTPVSCPVLCALRANWLLPTISICVI
jgi:hypothetical protein